MTAAALSGYHISCGMVKNMYKITKIEKSAETA